MPKHVLSGSVGLTSNGIGLYAERISSFVDLFGVQRSMVQLSCPIRRDSRLAIEIGETVTLRWPRWGWSDGKAFTVLSIEIRPKMNNMTFVLWG